MTSKTFEVLGTFKMRYRGPPSRYTLHLHASYSFCGACMMNSPSCAFYALSKKALRFDLSCAILFPSPSSAGRLPLVVLANLELLNVAFGFLPALAIG